MKLAFPHMGNLGVGLKALFSRLGIETVSPPPISRRTLELGLRHSPEYACLPFKINLGNFIEALEKGADTIVVAGGRGPCRFGFYGQTQTEILRNLGYRFRCVTVETAQKTNNEFFLGVKALTNGKSRWAVTTAIYFAWRKLQACDEAERLACRVRPFELKRGQASRVYQEAVSLIDRAETIADLRRVRCNVRARFRDIPLNTARKALEIGIVGEIYFINEPSVSLGIQERLGEMGVLVERSVYISDWVTDHIFLSPLGISPGRHYRADALPYLSTEIGGHAMETIGKAARWGKSGWDGLIQLAPFTCMPELVSKSLLGRVSEKYGIPVLSFFLDEQAGEAGVQTRLEAFVDLIQRRKRKIEKNKSKEVGRARLSRS